MVATEVPTIERIDRRLDALEARLARLEGLEGRLRRLHSLEERLRRLERPATPVAPPRVCPEHGFPNTEAGGTRCPLCPGAAKKYDPTDYYP